MTRAPLKGVHTLNPTRAVMKSNGIDSIRQQGKTVKGFKKVKPPKATKGKTK